MEPQEENLSGSRDGADSAILSLRPALPRRDWLLSGVLAVILRLPTSWEDIVTKQDASDALDLVEDMLDYVYVFAVKFQQFKARGDAPGSA